MGVRMRPKMRVTAKVDEGGSGSGGEDEGNLR